MKSSTFTVAFLVLVNLIPIFGVLFLGWDLFSLMILYWMENVIIGFFNTIKMAFASKSELNMGLSIGKKIFLIAFFSVHYGIFCQVHGLFITSFFGERGPGGFVTPFEAIMSMPQGRSDTFAWALLAMVLSHGLSLVLNFFGQKEYLKISTEVQMFQPYQRIIILHITILFSGFLVMSLGAPVLAMVIMAMLKIGFDVWAHLREHNKAQAPVLNTI